MASNLRKARATSVPFLQGPPVRLPAAGGAGTPAQAPTQHPIEDVVEAVEESGMDLKGMLFPTKGSGLLKVSQVSPSTKQQSVPQPQNADKLVMELTDLDPWEEVKGLPWVSVSVSGSQSGRLSQCLQNWRVVTGNPEILEMVRGVKLQFVSDPPLSGPKQVGPRFAQQEWQILDAEIMNLLEKEAIEEVKGHATGFYGHLFTRPKKDGSMRPVFNLKPLNRYVQYEHFKMENLPLATAMIEQGDQMGSVDLKNASFSVPIHVEHRKFLRFMWEGQIFQFRVIPFGLASAPRIFTKILKPVIALLRRVEIGMVQYLDDCLWMNQELGLGKKDRDSILYVLMEVGFTINWSKSQLEMTQVQQFFGLMIDSVRMKLSLPQAKVVDIKNRCINMLRLQTTTVRQLAKLVGKLTSTVLAIVPGPLFCRDQQMLKTQGLLKNRQSKEAEVTLTAECKTELSWWVESLEQHNGQSLILTNPDLMITTDASKTGWGAMMNGTHTQGAWSEKETQLHINRLELRAARFALQAFTKSHQNIHVHLRMDNSTAVAHVNKRGGNRSQSLVKETKELWQFCLERKITVTAEHLPGEWTKKQTISRGTSRTTAAGNWIQIYSGRWISSGDPWRWISLQIAWRLN